MSTSWNWTIVLAYPNGSRLRLNGNANMVDGGAPRADGVMGNLRRQQPHVANGAKVESFTTSQA
jgi:hypothetical protein